MFYAQFVLSKKGPLAKIWLAAHWEKKLSKAQIYETNVGEAVNEIIGSNKSQNKMTLRTTGHLLLGIVRIYSKKAKFLLADCNEAFMKLKMAFRSGNISAIENDEILQHVASSLPQNYTDFDTALPDFDADFNVHLAVHQSRIDDITLKEDNVHTGNLLNDDFGNNDDFGEAEFGGMELDDDFGDLGMISKDPTASDFGEMLSVGDANGPSSSTFADNDDFGNASGLQDDDMEGTSMMENGTMNSENARDESDDAIGAAPGSIAGDSDNYSVDTNEQEKIERRRRKRKLTIDEQKNIGGDEMKANMADFSDTLQSLDLAPPTRKLMKIRQSGNVEKLFHMPGCSFLKSKTLVRAYQTHLSARPKSNDALVEDLKRALLLSDILEDSIYHMPNSTLGDDHEDFNVPAVPDLDIQPESPTPLDNNNGSKDDEISPAEKKKRNKESKMEDDDQAVEEDEDHRWTKRTQGILNSIATKLRSSNEDEISLTDLLTKGSSRKSAAQKFYTLLVLKKWQAIDVGQAGPFGDILISAGPNINQVNSAH